MRPRRAARVPARYRHHGDRSDAGRRFPGRFGWGYDGVDLFAPTRLYGTPDDFRRFVDRAHASGLGVILDVVYNHFGPDGNYLGQFSTTTSRDRYKNEWGEALNFDGPDTRAGARVLSTATPRYWIDEFHLDGLRLDATQQIYDDSRGAHPGRADREQRAAGAPAARRSSRRGERAAGRATGSAAGAGRLRAGRAVERRFSSHRRGRADRAQRGLLHRLPGHAAGVHLAPRSTATCSRGSGTSGRSKRARHPGSGLAAEQRSSPSLQNHDQVANSARARSRVGDLAERGTLSSDDGADCCSAPERRCCSRARNSARRAPFYYFADHTPELGELVAKGRASS